MIRRPRTGERREAAGEKRVRIALAAGSFEHLARPGSDGEGTRTRFGLMAFVAPDGTRVPFSPLPEDDPAVEATGHPLLMGGTLHPGMIDTPRKIEMRALDTPAFAAFDRDGSTKHLLLAPLERYGATMDQLYGCYGEIPKATDG